MGEELNLGNLFVVCDDGTYVPFEGITETEIDLNDIQSDAVYDPIVPITNEPMTITFGMKHCHHRKMMKKLRAQINGYCRRKRHAIRQKERARRKLLKERKKCKKAENGKTNAKAYIVYQDEWLYLKDT